MLEEGGGGRSLPWERESVVLVRSTRQGEWGLYIQTFSYFQRLNSRLGKFNEGFTRLKVPKKGQINTKVIKVPLVILGYSAKALSAMYPWSLMSSRVMSRVCFPLQLLSTFFVCVCCVMYNFRLTLNGIQYYFLYSLHVYLCWLGSWYLPVKKRGFVFIFPSFTC